MKLYEIIIANNDSDAKYVSHFKDTDISPEGVKSIFKRRFINQTQQFDYAPEQLIICPGDYSDEILHAIAQFSNFHLEGTLKCYEEACFFEKLAAEPQCSIGDDLNIVIENDYDDDTYSVLLNGMMKEVNHA